MTAPVLPSTRPRTFPPGPAAASDGRPVTDGGLVTPAAPPSRQLARSHVSERDGTVVIELWVDPSRGPLPLRRLLVEETFAHPAVRARRPAVVSVPLGDSALLGEVGARLAMARTRACGTTCLIEGVVRG